MKKLTKHYSVKEFLDPKKNGDVFPECDDTKEINYFIFENKVEPYTKKR